MKEIVINVSPFWSPGFIASLPLGLDFHQGSNPVLLPRPLAGARGAAQL
jgi:hypothetical protein